MIRRRGQQGLSLLEILITMILISTTLVAFAAVYPASLKLNRKSQRSVQAAEYAGSVAEEIRNLPFTGPSLSIDDLYAWDPTQSAFAGFPRTQLPDPYTLIATDGSGQRGINVLLSGQHTATDPKTYADIIVTVYWKEPVNGRLVNRSTTVRTSRTSNR